MISDWALSQSYTEFIQWFIWALLLFALMFYTHEVGPSWFLSLHEIAQVLRGLPTILAFRVCIVPAHFFGLCYDHAFTLTT